MSPLNLNIESKKNDSGLCNVIIFTNIYIFFDLMTISYKGVLGSLIFYIFFSCAHVVFICI